MVYRKAVFIVVYAKTQKGIRYLLLKRKLHWVGWEFPKGGRRKFESKKQTVRREVFEETGLKPLKEKGKVKIKGFNFKGKYKYPREFPDRPGIKGQTFHLFAAEVKKPKNGKIRFGEKEHSDYKWASYSQARKIIEWPNQKKALKIVDGWLKEKLH